MLLSFANAELDPVSVDRPERTPGNSSDSKVVIVIEIVVEDRIEIDKLPVDGWLESFLDRCGFQPLKKFRGFDGIVNYALEKRARINEKMAKISGKFQET